MSYPAPIPQVPLVYEQLQPQPQQEPQPEQHLITGVISTLGETATLPEQYFPYVIGEGKPSTFMGTTGQPRAPTGSEYKYYSVHPKGAGFYKDEGKVKGDPWTEYYAEHGKPSPEMVSQLQSISASAEAQFQLKEYQLHTAGLKEFKGDFSDYGMRMAAAPIGTPIPGQQEYAKIQQLQTGKEVFGSEEEFKQVVEPLSKYGAFAGVTEFRGTIVTPQPQLMPSPALIPGQEDMYKAFEDWGKPPKETLFPSYLSGRSESEFFIHPKYGQVIPMDISEGLQAARTQREYKSLLPENIGLSKLSTGFYKSSIDISEGIRKFTIDTGKLPKEIRESPGMKMGTFVFQKGRESTARLTEFVGTIPGTTEIWGKTAISKPAAIPSMVLYGGLAVSTGIGKQIVAEPAQFISDIFVTTGAFKLAGKFKTGITEPISFKGKTYVPAESIIEPQVLSGKERFPLAPRGTTGAQLVREFEIGKFRMPGTEGKIGGWHATPEAFAKTTLTEYGQSEGVGLYISPSTSPHFWKISGGQFKLFGWGSETPTSPAGIWLETAGIKRSPLSTRFNIEAQNVFLESKAPKGTGFISAAFEKGIKPEKEAIIPPETPIIRVSNQFYTKYKGKRVPLMEYTAVQKSIPDIIDYGKSTLFEKELPGITSWGRQHIEAGGQFFPHGIKTGITLTAPLVMGGFKTKPQKEETFEELSKKQIKISSEYSKYKEPIFTPSSIVSSIKSSYRTASMSSIKLSSSYAKPSISSPGRYATSSIYSSISSQNYPTKISSILSPGRSTYTSKTSYPSKTTYPGYPKTPTTPFTPIIPKIKLRSSTELFQRKRRKGKIKGSKFPEISRVALPKSVMRGFRL